jgi:hypothetical protein
MADWERQQGNTRSAVRYLLLSLRQQPFNKHTPARMFNLASCIPGFSSIWNTLKP